MALQKQNVNINFAQGLETKTDPFQIPPGKFLLLRNTVFNKGRLLKKRNGYGLVTSLDGASTITTFNDNLVAIGNTLSAYSADNGQLINSGYIQPLSLSVQPLVRRATSQTTVDVAVEPNGLACSTWLDADGSSYYQLSDSVTSQTVVPEVALPATAVMSRVFVLGRYFIVTFLATVSASTHLQYIAIPIVNPTNPGSATDLSTAVSGLTAAYDGLVANNTLYFSWNGNDGGGAVRSSYLTSGLTQGTTVSIASQVANLITIAADTSGSSPVIWVSFYRTSTNLIKAVAYNPTLVTILSATTAVSSITINEITSTAVSNVLTIFYEVANTYSYSPNAKSDYISKNTVTIAGSVGTPAIILRSVGLASKATYLSDKSSSYMLVTFGSSNQPTYFLMDSSGNIDSKLAYANGGGYLINQILPGVNVRGDTISIGYLFKDLLAATNKTQGLANSSAVYSQTGINVATFTFQNSVNTSDIGRNLHISGGFLWMYDGVKAVEHNFHVWPEEIAVTPHTSGGSMADQTYFYQVCYEWTDNQGNIHRSAPSIPIAAVVSGGSGSGSVTVNIPTLRLTYKTTNKVRIVIYRWSVAQQSFYRITSISSPTLNNPAADSVAFVDTLADSAILGNDLIYTTGGVVEDIAAPGSDVLTLYKSRLFLVDAEDRNLIWYSKQTIQATPVEMSDLFTIFVSPTTGSQGSTGSITALFPMDDKLIIFKENAVYYLTGNGPDNTGANNDFSEPIFITSSVGCTNPDSIVMTPNGLMFQSNKGIFLLGRDLSTLYIGADVEEFNSQIVTSAISVPETNEVRFTLDNGLCLMYDYFYGQWGSFSNISALSSTIFQGLHTYLNEFGQLLQETPGLYLDVSKPVLVSFQTGWFNFAGLQGYQRAYFFYMLAEFFSPHKIQIQIGYDYSPSPSQSLIITPDNYNPPLGDDTVLGSTSPFGGQPTLEQWRIFFQQQRCQTFQIYLNEIFDSSFGVAAGAGLTISGLNLVCGIKKGFVPIMATNSAG